MASRLTEGFLRAVRRRDSEPEPAPLLVELFGPPEGGGWYSEAFPFFHRVRTDGGAPFYEVGCALPASTIGSVRKAVRDASEGLDPREVVPLTFARLLEVLTQRTAEGLASSGTKQRIRELSELAAFEALGLSRILALAKDQQVTEFFVDSEDSPIYLDHTGAGRCESSIVLVRRERDAIQTHLDTFSGYTLDYRTPSLKNDLTVGGALLRVSLDLEPIAVNRFALDVRRLNVSTLTLPQLIGMGVLSAEAAGFLVGWLEVGGNLTIVGETGTGKTTLLNALDARVERRFRRLYIEDAVETRDLLAEGYHQMKVKVDPFERGEESGRTKESEIVKALHRSPDMVILSEIQSEEHSRAFFQALASGARGIQTFHASTVEQAVRRWVNMHHISDQSLLDLGVLVQMARPDRLGQRRQVHRICAVVEEGGGHKMVDVFARDGENRLRRLAGPGWPALPHGVEPRRLDERVDAALRSIEGTGAS